MISMSRTSFLVSALFLLYLLEESFFSSLFVFGVPFNVYLIFLFFPIILLPKNSGLYLAVWGGLILDLFSFLPFGVFAFALLPASILVKRLSYFFHRLNILTFLPLFLVYLVSYKVFFLLSIAFFTFILDKV